jgi:putative pyruvate formate lyase activating enzyme
MNTLSFTALPTSCDLCPRHCGANRRAGQAGICGADDTLKVARAALHHWEEPPISGTRGSGTVFFVNCPLRCVYCQNYELAHGTTGKAITPQRLANIFLDLQAQGAHNINLVTPTQYRPQIMDALLQARELGLRLPIVYNTSGYETGESVHALRDYVDIWLTDLKYVSPELSARYSHAPDYFEVAAAALEAMVDQTGPVVIDDDGILQRGVIVRHLLLPGALADAKAVVRHLAARYLSPTSIRVSWLRLLRVAFGNKCKHSFHSLHLSSASSAGLARIPPFILSLMNQYTPLPPAADFTELRTPISETDYDELVDYALDLGLTHSFMQEGPTAAESFIPAFDNTGV